MTDDQKLSNRDYQCRRGSGVSSGVYGLGFIGAAVYFLQHADTIWAGVLGFFKALFWPAVLVYKLLELWQI